MGDAGGGDYWRESDDDRFTHLDADLLRAHFDVQSQVFERATVVPESTLPDGVTRPDVMAAVRAQVLTCR